MSEPCFSKFNLSITDIFSRSAPSFFSGKLFQKILSALERFPCWTGYVRFGQKHGKILPQKPQTF